MDARTSALEEQTKKAKIDSEERREKLEHCFKVEADQVYWDLVKVNSAYNPKTGIYSGPARQFERAEREKRDKIEECKLLYGR